MIKYTLLLTSFLSFSSFVCEVRLPHQMLIIGNDSYAGNIYESKNCIKNSLEELHQTVSGMEGRIPSAQLEEILSSKGYKIQISPPSIKIQQLKTLMRDQLDLPSGIRILATYSLDMSSIIPLVPGDRIEVSCNSCLFGNKQPINLTIRGFDGNKRSLFATADFRKMVKAYRLTSPLTSFSHLDINQQLREEYVESIPHTDLVTDLDSLKFYKTNKPLKTGDLLKKSDLNALNIVKAGLKTDVILENQMVRIKTQGISRGNGAIGDVVEVFHPQKNKKYQGRVIDVNKVLVEL